MSNQNLHEFTANTEYVGVDKLWITLPIEPERSDDSAGLLRSRGFAVSSKGYPITYAKGTHYLGDSPVHIKVFDNGNKVQLRFNPARVLDSEGTTLCDPKNLKEIVFWLLRYLKYVFIPKWALNTQTGERFENLEDWPDNWDSFVSVQRVDIARDFYTDEKAFDVNILESVRKKNFPRDFIYRYGGKSQTITWGSANRARMQFYNKSDAHKIENGWYRFEVQARTTYLKTIGVASLRDLTATKLYSELQYRWEQSCFNSLLSLGGGLAEFYSEMVDKFSPETAINFLGLATAIENGIEPQVHPRTIQKYQKIGNSLGFNLGSDLASFGSFKGYLDIRTGKLLRAS